MRSPVQSRVPLQRKESYGNVTLFLFVYSAFALSVGCFKCVVLSFDGILLQAQKDKMGRLLAIWIWFSMAKTTGFLF